MDQQPTWIGRTLSSRYRIDALLGQGGMSAVASLRHQNIVLLPHPPDRPVDATEICALVANSNHSIVPGSGNCVNLP